jgi:hypothetical protein
MVAEAAAMTVENWSEKSKGASAVKPLRPL